MSEYSLETMFQIWNDKHGERIEVRPDRDGLNLVEVVSFDGTGKEEVRMTFTQSQANLVATAMKNLISTLPTDSDPHGETGGGIPLPSS